MRSAFTNTLFTEAQKNKDIILLTGDLGFSIFEPFRDLLRKQYLNTGVSEQNMTGMAAGLAMEGKIPIIYSIIPFITMRNFEQIRNDICYQNQNVKIVGVGSGFSYGAYGHTHHSLEDMGIMRTLANLVILSPSDPIEARQATKWMLRHRGPVYLRLGKAGEPTLESKYTFKLGKGHILKYGTDVAILSTGAITASALDVARKLDQKHISTQVISMPSIKPLDIELIKSLSSMKVIVTLEEHSIIGGLGTAVAEVIAENNLSVSFRRIGVPDRFTPQMGRHEYMKEVNKLSPAQIVKTISHMLSKMK